MNYKKFLPDVLMIALFVVISLAYFWNPIMDGLVLTGTDHNAAVGSNVELNEYRKAHNGERTRWTNSLFSGMPTYQMSPSYNSTDTLSTIETIYQLGLPTVAAYVFIMLLGFYILLRAFDFRAWMAALGAILWAFSSYYFIIIAAGHIWKLLTLSFIPPTIAGMVLCYRGKYLWGIVVTGIFTALQVLSNHIQMSYYFLPVMALMAIAFLFKDPSQPSLEGEGWGRSSWLKGTLAALIGGLLGVSINISNLYHTYEYSKETMRGKSELTQKTKNAEDQTSSGLERSYITAWSYGIDETWTLLVPNTKGGASLPLTQSEKAMEKANPQYRPLYQQLGQYWGDQPGTSGPVYVGAFVLFLFVLGLFIVKGPMKWALLIATVLSILLSWGRNFMPLTDFFLDYVPMYDKFRTVASILVIAEFTIPLLAMFALKKVVEEVANPNCQSSIVNYQFLISLALTAGICFLFWLMPDVFFGNYLSMSESSALQGLTESGMSQQIVNDIIANLSDMRRAVFTADAMRSCIIILIGFGILMLYRYRKLKEVPMVACLALLCLFDMWSVNKRYLSDDDFVRPRTDVQAFPMSDADMEILQDSDAYYRVLNLSVNTFNDNTTSYYHKSIGGYHAAKLRRYQELIEEHIQAQIDRAYDAAAQGGGYLDQCNGDSLFPVLNMLNMKYMILPLKDNGKISVLNPHANGNAWFVDKVHYVEDADAELKGLHGLDTKHEAVADKKWVSILSPDGDESTSPRGDRDGAVLTSYEANRLAYTVFSEKGGVLVFSEIYYPGWTCTVDGNDVEIGRVDYVLRAIHIDGGIHEVVLTFKPRSERITEAIAYSALGLLALLFVGLLVRLFMTHKKQNKS
ncbi:MAG: YfhO family protein [Bacteroidaceae bacterium]|nr:YfhO family protein [Bacteroidaceae bacterium]